MDKENVPIVVQICFDNISIVVHYFFQKRRKRYSIAIRFLKKKLLCVRGHIWMGAIPFLFVGWLHVPLVGLGRDNGYVILIWSLNLSLTI
jgi:hypothetical protein